MTMEWLDGAKLCDASVRQMPSSDLRKVTRLGADMYLEMIFHHGFYHGDPHPGNLVVMPSGAIGLLDFGMVARLDEHLREDIEDMLIAIISQDSQQLTSVWTSRR
jgi:ubiquinone biosynthesis protein